MASKDERIAFTHLHVHTDASLMDGLGPVERTVNAASSKRFLALAITDHGTLANAISFYLACKNVDIKPIIGLEAYIYIDGTTGHMTLLADGNEGFDSLVKLNNLAHASDYKRPAITIDSLIENSKGLVVLSGCVSSPLNTFDFRAAVSLGAKLKSAFESKFFIELMLVSDTDTWSRPIKLAQKLNVPLVLTNDAHFPFKDDASTHTNLTQMKAGFSYHNSELWLKTSSQLLTHAKAYSEIPIDLIKAAMIRAHKIGKLIKPPTFARAPLLPEFEDSHSALVSAIKAGSVERGLGTFETGHTGKRLFSAVYLKRVKMELEIISKMGYEAYFLMLKKLVDYAREKGVAVGPGRGSGAGSLILYLLQVTNVDPLEYGLPFERFLNPERAGMPDVDIDFEQERRHIVLNYAIDELKATQIATYSRYQHRMLVGELAKVYRVPPHMAELAKDLGIESSSFKQICERFPGFEKDYDAMITQIRHKGKHAAGIVFETDRVPIERLSDGTLAAAWTEGKHNELSHVGMVKFDLLGLSAMSVLRRLRRGLTPSVAFMEKEKKVWELFSSGRVNGIFQFEGSAGIRDLVMKLKPESVLDLAAASALYRPGALDAGATSKYPEWKESPRKVPKLFAKALRETYGAIVFQEQMMEVFALATGGTLAEADLARRVLLKTKMHDSAWWESLEKIKSLFINGAISRGLGKEEAESWWEEIQTHSRYSFNKAHAVSYAIISLELAYWKAVNPARFYAETMNVDQHKMSDLLAAAVTEGINISTPQINRSSSEFEASDDGDKEQTIYLPFSAIKFLGKPGAQAIEEARAKGVFTSVEDFMKRVPKRTVTARARLGLFNLGGFNGFVKDVWATIELLFGKKFDSRKIIADREKAQIEHLGFIIPTEEHIRKMAELSELGWTCGFVARTKTKVSSYGPYIVYTLSPTGSFWHRAADMEEIPVGTLIAIMKSPSSGKLTKIKRL